MFRVSSLSSAWLRTSRSLCGVAVVMASLVSQTAVAQTSQSPLAQPSKNLPGSFAKLPLRFEPNVGQTDERVQFVARTPQSTVYLTGSDVTLQTANLQRNSKGEATVSAASAIRMHLAGSAATSAGTPQQPQGGTTNYLRGADKNQWHTALPGYGAVQFHDVYPGIGLNYHGHEGQLEYDFIVAANADVSAVKLHFDGTEAKLDGNGDLILPTGIGSDLRFDKPIAYQTINGKRVNVAAAFAMDAQRNVTFRLGGYDHTRELTIDPTLVYLGTIGSGIHQIDLGQVAVDSAGSMYFIGTTDDLNYPVTSGSYQTVCGPSSNRGGQITYYGGYCPANGGGETSAFVTKLSADGTRLVYSTYLSGKSGVETGGAITVDSSGVAYLLGRTGSDDFPVTSDAFQKHCVAQYGVFGGPNNVPCDGNYNGGGTEYTIQNEMAYFSKLSADGTSLLYSSFLGGTQPVYPNTIALDTTGNIYISGQVILFSANDLAPCANGYNQGCQPNIQFPGVTSSGYQTISTALDTYGAPKSINAAAFLSKFSNDGHTLLYGTFFADNTTGVDVSPTTMAVGANGVAFLGGYTDATNFPTTTGAIKKACTQANTGYNGIYCNTVDGYVAAIDTTKSGTASLLYSTRLGGSELYQGNNSPQQQILGLAADSSNNAYVTGYTTDSSFNMPAKGFQTTCPNNTGNVAPTTSGYIDRCNSAFVLKINPTGTAIAAGSFLGGPTLRSAGSVGYNVRLDSKGQIYLYGVSNDGGGDFPQLNPLQGYKGGNQLFITAFTTDLTNLLFSTRFGNPSYTDHSVGAAGGLAIGADDNLYFAGVTTDTMFTGTTGAYSTAVTTGAGRHPFFVKLSKVLQPDTTTLTLTPTTLAAGNKVTYKAVVTGLLQTTPVATGNVTFTATNTTPATVLGTASLDKTGTATLTATVPAAGTYSVIASYVGDTVYDVSSSAASTLTVNTGVATTTTLTSSASSAAVGSPLTFTASVSSANGTATGTVTFFDGTTSIGTGTLASGKAALTISTLGAGSHSITAMYGGDTQFLASTSAALTETVVAPSIAVTASPASLTIPSGSSGTLTLTATPTGPYSGVLNFSCVNLPAHAACLFAPATLTFSQSATAQTSTLTFTTKDGATAMLRSPGANRGYQIVAAFLFLPLGLIGLAVGGRRTSLRNAGLWLLLFASTSLLTLSGCGSSGNNGNNGGSGGSGNSGNGSATTTSTGAYTVQVTTTVNGGTTQVPISVTVQ